MSSKDSETTGTVISVQALAAEAYSCFETARRATGDTETGPREDGEPYTRVREGSPEWVTDMVHDAHGDMLPDDWRYDCIRAACEAIEDNDGDEDSHEFADAYVDVYNSALIGWLGSHGYRQSYVDDAVNEYGMDSDGGIARMMQLGQYMEANEVYGLVFRFLENRAEELSDDV